jgi:hypothetical protein
MAAADQAPPPTRPSPPTRRGCGPMEPLETATKTDGVFAPPARRTVAAPTTPGVASGAAAPASRAAAARAGRTRPVVHRPPTPGDVASRAGVEALRPRGRSPRSTGGTPDVGLDPSDERSRESGDDRPPDRDEVARTSAATSPVRLDLHAAIGNRRCPERQEKVVRICQHSQGSEQDVYPETPDLTDSAAALH